jgi:hypothetical protein
MSKGEVKSLQDLAKANGGSLTINPETGLTEAGFLSNALPTLIGAGVGFATGNPWLGAAIAGGLKTAQTGSLTQGIMAGAGAYGFAGLGAGAAGYGSFAGEAAGETAAAQGAAAEASAVPPVTDAGSAVGTGPATTNPVTQGSVTGTPLGSSPSTPFQMPAGSSTVPDVSTMTPQTGYVPPASANVNPYTMTQAEATGAATNPSAGLGTTSAGTNAATAPKGMGIGEAAWKNVQADPKLGIMAAGSTYAYAQPDRNTGAPTIKHDADKGQQYKFEKDANYQNARYTPISDTEANQLYHWRAANGGLTPSFADGGAPVGYEDDANVAPAGYEGGIREAFPGYDVAPNQGISAAMSQRDVPAPVSAPSNGFRFDPTTGTFVGSGPSGNTIYKGGGEYGLDEAGQKAADETAAPAPTYDGGGGNANGGLMQAYASGGPIQSIIDKLKAQGAFDEPTPQYSYDQENQTYEKMAEGGLSHLGSYSDGGRLLRGPGDGVSDSIPAMIGKKQPARLADGEFVVPARIVSEIGNGSTEAGARKLYAMMDRVQKARGKTVGKGKIAKNTRADKFLPA